MTDWRRTFKADLWPAHTCIPMKEEIGSGFAFALSDLLGQVEKIESSDEFRSWGWRGPDVQLWKKFSYTLKESTSGTCQQEDALGCSRPKADNGCKGFRSPDCIWLKKHRTSNTSVNSVLFPESRECDLVGSSLLEIRVEVFSVWKGHPDWMALPWETGQN